MPTDSSGGRHLHFDEPAIYQIRVEGWLDPAWSARMEGMTITAEVGDDKLFITTLRGYLADQAALAGVLSQLYDMQFSVLTVLRCENE